MRIIGIDPGTAICGYGIIDVDAVGCNPLLTAVLQPRRRTRIHAA